MGAMVGDDNLVILVGAMVDGVVPVWVIFVVVIAVVVISRIRLHTSRIKHLPLLLINIRNNLLLSLTNNPLLMRHQIKIPSDNIRITQQLRLMMIIMPSKLLPIKPLPLKNLNIQQIFELVGIGAVFG